MKNNDHRSINSERDIMKHFAHSIVKFRIPILIAAVVLLIPSLFSYLSTKVNYDILYYLPESIDTMKGQDLLMDEFGKGAYAVLIFEDMSDKDVSTTLEKIEDVDHVDTVLSYSEISDKVPAEMLPDEIKDVFYSADDSDSLAFLFFDTTTSNDETLDAIKEIRQIAGDQCFLSSMSAIVEDTKELTNNELVTYVSIAVILCLIVLMLNLDSFLTPILFLLDIGMAIIYNLGTNFIQGEISFITMSLVAVLQLGVTMDYSIFLYNSYREQKKLCNGDNKKAMEQAIVATISSVTGSSLTTIAGFIALCFMTFTLGLDLGVVMAKGVLFGVISCVTILPSLVLVFDKAIQKTSHKKALFEFNPKKITDFVVKHHKAFIIIMIILWVPSIFGYNRINVYYKLDSSLPQYLGSVQANEKLRENFDMNSISMVLVSSDLDKKDTKAMCSDMEDVDGVNFVLGLDSVVGSQVPDELIPQDLKDTLDSGNYKLLLISSEYEVATDEVNAQCTELENIIKQYDSGSMLIGEAPCTKDLIEITNVDFNTVSIVSIGLIFVIILLVLKSALLPALLVVVIELAIYINMSLAFYTNTTLPFIASIVIGTIQLGSTVDYAILMTTRYKVERINGLSKEDSVKVALSTSLHSIITSALGLFAATIGVAIYSDVDLISSLCMLMGRGALISMAVVIFMLPSVLLLFDKPICATTAGMRKLRRAPKEGK